MTDLAARVEELQAENRRLQREVEESARLGSEFLSNFSHEIRTPLNGILGYCDLLLREEGQRLTPHGRRDLSIIQSNARTLLGLINDILDLSRIEAGHAETAKESVEMAPLVDECLSALKELLAGKDVETRAEIAPACARVFTDPLKIRQVLLHLLSNAAKFTDAGRVVCTLGADGSALVVQVEDTGAGIPSEQIPFIFDKFRQVDGSSRRRAGGTGLGLAIVREVSNLLGGSVTVTSSVGRGSTFTVRLPDAIDLRARLPRILYVDDSAQNREIVRRYLGPDYELSEADDGEHGLERAAREVPDVILMDLSLPRVDGWEVTRRLKADPALRHIPVIALTAHAAREDQTRAQAAGCCEYLTKPLEREALIAAIRRQLAAAQAAAAVAPPQAHA